MGKTRTACLACLSLAACCAGAQSFPAKPLRIIVPFAASGPADFTARLLGPHITRQLGQQVIVDNRVGANGIIGVDNVAKSAADGYTIGIGNSTEIVMQLVEKSVEYDMTKFTHIGFAQSSPTFYFVKNDSPSISDSDEMRGGSLMRLRALPQTDDA